MSKKATDTIQFEQALSELDQVVDKLESEPLNLQDALQYFERGITLTRTCQEALKQAEQKVEQVCQSLEPESGSEQ